MCGWRVAPWGGALGALGRPGGGLQDAPSLGRRGHAGAGTPHPPSGAMSAGAAAQLPPPLFIFCQMSHSSTHDLEGVSKTPPSLHWPSLFKCSSLDGPIQSQRHAAAASMDVPAPPSRSTAPPPVARAAAAATPMSPTPTSSPATPLLASAKPSDRCPACRFSSIRVARRRSPPSATPLPPAAPAAPASVAHPP